MTLADFTSPGLIIPTLSKQDVAGVIQELAHALQAEGRVPDVLPFYHAVLNREYLVSTEMEAGIAFPHARLTEVGELCFAFGRSEKPLVWGGGARSVRIVFLTAVPESDSMRYLSLISGFARLTKENSLTEKLFAGERAEEILQVLQEITIKNNFSAATKKPETKSIEPTASSWSRRFLKI